MKRWWVCTLQSAYAVGLQLAKPINGYGSRVGACNTYLLILPSGVEPASPVTVDEAHAPFLRVVISHVTLPAI